MFGQRINRWANVGFSRSSRNSKRNRWTVIATFSTGNRCRRPSVSVSVARHRADNRDAPIRAQFRKRGDDDFTVSLFFPGESETGLDEGVEEGCSSLEPLSQDECSSECSASCLKHVRNQPEPLSLTVGGPFTAIVSRLPRSILPEGFTFSRTSISSTLSRQLNRLFEFFFFFLNNRFNYLLRNSKLDRY